MFNTSRTLIAMVTVYMLSACGSGTLGQALSDVQDGEVTGELEVLYFDDFEHERGELRYLVHDKLRDEPVELEFEGAPPAKLVTGSYVRIRGTSTGDGISIEANSAQSVETLAAADALVSGEQKTIVLVVNFSDAIVSCSVQDLEARIFSDPNGRSVNDLFRETSLDAMQLTGMVAEPVTLPHSGSEVCGMRAWGDEADALVIANGVDLSLYSRKVYVFPEQNGCGWSGVATVGGSPSKAWIMRCAATDVIAHELGHNLGMGHAGDAQGSYNDDSDIMGSVGSDFMRQINGPHQVQMGWRAPLQTTEVRTDGIYDIAPLELNAAEAASAQILKMRKADTAEWYYLSYRQLIGFDTALSARHVAGVSIHHHEGANWINKTVWVGTMIDGAAYTDSANQLVIRQVSHDENGVSVEITFPKDCTRNSPSVDVTPLSQTGVAGSTFSYNLTLINNDTAYCPDSVWTLSSDVPAEWTDVLSGQDITVAPGESALLTWEVTSPNTALDANYALSLELTDSESVSHDSYVIANYSVTTPGDTESPTAPSGLTAAKQGKSISVNWKASADNSEVAGYRVFRNDIEIGTSASTSYVDRSVTHGSTYSYFTVAFDAASNLSDPSNVATAIFGKTNAGKKGREVR